MTQVATEAIVLHAFDYRETSRILRLVTREHGVRSAIARGARRPRNRYGAALDLFAEGTAQISLHATGDLHTLVSFDVTRSRPELAGSWSRFAAANALAEMVLRFARDDEHAELFDAFRDALESLAEATGPVVTAAGLGGAWSLLSQLGFAPALDDCVSCDAPIPAGRPAHFSQRLGGVLCDGCAAASRGTRVIPAAAREAIGAWASGRQATPADPAEAKAHLRLLREFVHHHLADDRPLRAFPSWENS